MKKLVWVALTAVAACASAQTIQVNKENRTIAITASAEAEALADVAVVHIGYQDYGADETSAYANGSKRSNAIVVALEKSGVAKESIESQEQQLQPLGEYEIKNLSAEQKAYRYRVMQSWSVRAEPATVAKILDVAVKAGANQSGNISWQMKDQDQLEVQAAEKAIAKAQRIASQMAEGLHIHLGPLVYASNQEQSAAPRPLPVMARAMSLEQKSAEISPLAINARKITSSATVYAVFSVE